MLDIPRSPLPDSPDDFPLRQFVTFRMSRVQARLNAQASAILERHCGLSLIQWRALAILAILGETTPMAVARFGRLDKGLLSRKLKALIAEKLVSSRADPHDQRSQLLSLTDAGQAVYDRMLPIMEARQAHLVADLDAAQRTAFLEALDRIEEAAERRDFEP